MTLDDLEIQYRYKNCMGCSASFLATCSKALLLWEKFAKPAFDVSIGYLQL